MTEQRKVKFDTTIRLDLVLTIALMVLSAIVFGANLVGRVEAVESNQQSTAQILKELEGRVRDAERLIDRAHPDATR